MSLKFQKDFKIKETEVAPVDQLKFILEFTCPLTIISRVDNATINSTNMFEKPKLTYFIACLTF